MGFSADETGALVAVVVGEAVVGSLADEQPATNIATHAAAKTLPIADSSPGRPAQIGVWAEPADYSSAIAR